MEYSFSQIENQKQEEPGTIKIYTYLTYGTEFCGDMYLCKVLSSNIWKSFPT